MSGPLSGVRVLDLSRVLAGPFCTMLLGEHTEEVLRDVLGMPPEEIRALVGRA